MHDHVQRDTARRCGEVRAQPIERPELAHQVVIVRADGRTELAHHRGTVHVRAHDRIAELVAGAPETGVVRQRRLLVFARLLETRDHRAAVRQNFPAVELVVDDGRGLVLRVAPPDHVRELGLVARLKQRHEILAAVVEVEPDQVELLAECRLDVLLPVETAGFEDVLLERIDGFLLAGEVARECVDHLPLRGARVRVDLDEHRRRLGDYVACSRSRPLCASAPRGNQRSESGSRDRGEPHGQRIGVLPPSWRE